MIKRVLVALLSLVAVSSATPASATGFRYWTYWHGDSGGWHFASSGPYFTQLTQAQDPAVDGWRFAVSDPYGPPPPTPRYSSKYTDLCHDAPRAGYVRLAIVIDFGLPADAPPGDAVPSTNPKPWCTIVPVGTDAFTAMQNYAKIPIRADPSSFICGIWGYPKTECANVNATAAPSPTPALPTPAPTTPIVGSTSRPTPNVSHRAPSSAPPIPATPAGAATSTLTFSPDPLVLAATPPTPKRPWIPLAGGGAAVALLGALALRRSRRH